MSERMPLTSEDVLAERTARLRELFPEAFAEGKVDFEKLKAALGEEVSTDRERYGLSWAGKSEAVRNVQTPSVAALAPDRGESVDFDATENLFIEGDNLEVLKLLQKSYHGRVKMIYIDPPYNTGGEFIYPDNFREGIDDYLRYSGQITGDGLKLSTNTETSGRYHSKWLNMMYPRLFLARNLLREDGVIFVSIDDHEVHNLRLMMNEVFGEENFLASFVWKRRSGAMDAVNNVSSDHEYAMCFGRTQISLAGQERTFERYDNPDNDPRGPWVADNLSAAKPGGDTFYAIRDPRTGNEYWPPKGRYWPYSKSTMKKKIEEGRIIFPDGPQGSPLLKRFKNEAKSLLRPVSTWIAPLRDSKQARDSQASVLTTSLNAEGTREVKQLFDDKAFIYPKPTSLIKSLINQGMGKDDIVLDFFAGSATTAHAVLDQNKEDGGNRKFIMAQLPEPTDNPEYPTIADIGKERVRRVIGRMNEEDEGRLNTHTPIRCLIGASRSSSSRRATSRCGMARRQPKRRISPSSSGRSRRTSSRRGRGRTSCTRSC